jgi:peptidoglycan/xylan/chitin deacetylase (PgdA/CDA1 family)
VHGWTHRPHLVRTPTAVITDIGRARRAVAEVTGQDPRFWRPSIGILSGAGSLGAARHKLRPVLWTADGKDCRPNGTGASVCPRIVPQLRPGGVVLLHDSEITSAPGSWRAVVAALPDLVAHRASAGWPVGTVREHSGWAAPPA